tara:strand:+ start:956 stop:1189 length:234 start_codon:yes stop_codon:yes gene_type:complete
MRDKLEKYYDDLDNIFERLRLLEEKSHTPQNFTEHLNDFKHTVKERMLDLLKRVGRLEDQLEKMAKFPKPRKKEDPL